MTNAERATELRARALWLYRRARYYRDVRGDMAMASALRVVAWQMGQAAEDLDSPFLRDRNWSETQAAVQA